MVRKLVVLLVVTVAGMGTGPSPQAQQPAQNIPSGRVCIQKQFGAKPPAAPVADPIWFLSPGAIADTNGLLYSTSPSGGKTGAGAAFEISPAGALRVLTSFAQYDTSTGSGPQSGLVNGHDGYLYGTTYGGGRLGVGTLFRIKPTQNKAEILWNFRNGSTIGLLPTCPPKKPCWWPGRLKADIAASYPTAPPVMGPGGVLYGVTSWSNNQGLGVLYKMTPPYDSTSFHALCIFDQRMLADTSMAKFVCKAKVNFPTSLLLDSAGTTLYGTTGLGPGTSLHGAVFKATASTGDASVLHAFDLTNGSKPYNLLMGSDGRLYGTTANGGAVGVGTVYRLDTSGGGFTVMSSFRVNRWLQGANPFGGLAEMKPAGSVEPFLFGTTKFGGKYGRGTLFRIPLTGDSMSLRVLHDFDFGLGRSPITVPVAARSGKIYGLTYQGGSMDGGVLYALDPIVLNETTTRDAVLNFGVAAKDDAGVPIKDSLVQIFTDAQASQSGVDATGKPVTTTEVGGIRVLGYCPNAHIVQFLYRERIAPGGTAYTNQIATVSGTYQLSDVTKKIVWNTDVPLTKMILGPFEQRNAYLDQANGAGHNSAAKVVAIFDKPSFGVFDDPTRPSTVYLPANQNANAKLSETWRATARDFLVCNCQLSREIWWSREVVGNKATYRHIKVVMPAQGALAWINAQLKLNGYAPIP